MQQQCVVGEFEYLLGCISKAIEKENGKNGGTFRRVVGRLTNEVSKLSLSLMCDSAAGI